jgi:hypothetical protein
MKNCGTRRWRNIRPGQLELLQHVLAHRTVESAPPASCILFQASKKRSNIPYLSAQGSRASGGQSSNTASGSGSSAQKKYTPVQGGATSIGSGIPGLAPTQISAGLPGSGTVVGTHVPVHTASGTNKQLWLIFGAEGSMELQELGQISSGFLNDDQTFIRELRRQHQQVRGWTRMLFSMWRLRYWEFVKVSFLNCASPAHFTY